MAIPFNKPFVVGKELFYISQAVLEGNLAGDGRFTKLCHRWMEERFGARKVLLSTSCTAALEMCAILADIGPGDEVIMPSYTFVSTANAFVLRGASIKFVDIRKDTLNIDETLIEAAITDRTKAIVPVHYAGVGCEMDTIMEIAERHNLLVIEDAAQGVNATYKGRYLGTIGHLGTYSFHETKNFISGEGGALVINDDRFLERAEIIREKGTNRSQFFRGEVDKYTWVDVGSSYLPSEMIAAFLYAQLEEAEAITSKRLSIVGYYSQKFGPLQEQGLARLPFCSGDVCHNAHMFYLLLSTARQRDELLAYLKNQGVGAVFHYVPLHTSPMGREMGYEEGDLPLTEDLSSRILRLPCYFDLTREEQDRVVGHVFGFLGQGKGRLSDAALFSASQEVS
ncbi:MAG: dTDP-4-amino-4,6-dideoxygalactose transaminase [Desulfuromonas sp.]|uniref:dTDP-4-amino-4,6-dideoxygalactose transaminase n=1 Tax=Desulfuromonas sp. TaxID=892 RepID=UPI000CB85A3D|nr:dTDP-4-amino-4,6-dideoxygalactose transaminase [Desulfuromonas sp.]PLX84416.1 MAG: dTDP-4-amino-4,6-dideoxygalactose transaminase [Desulfuromonas sp.]